MPIDPGAVSAVHTWRIGRLTQGAMIVCACALLIPIVALARAPLAGQMAGVLGCLLAASIPIVTIVRTKLTLTADEIVIQNLFHRYVVDRGAVIGAARQRDGVGIYYRRDSDGIQVVTAAATQGVLDGALFRRSRVADVTTAINRELATPEPDYAIRSQAKIRW